ncbi:hypothetical protein [Methanobrevibacter arboriphilus]|uniref:Uncharacterized protein n=2 Tax=Methanobrevibacter arboriphilus TaxID=39441 RepID=A0ACA8R406_METAZ|nr:hypothetical protein [Methanobrevibacter arboriphilus]BBL62012.1 hypothetical protein MarbSA_10520 [Methanobrevibacter arboriphilus]
MKKNKKIILGIVIAVVAVIGVGVLISAMNNGPTAEIGGNTYHIGDYISFEAYNSNLTLDTYVTQIDEKAMYSETKDGKYMVQWDLEKGNGILVKYPDSYLYNY